MESGTQGQAGWLAAAGAERAKYQQRARWAAIPSAGRVPRLLAAGGTAEPAAGLGRDTLLLQNGKVILTSPVLRKSSKTKEEQNFDIHKTIDGPGAQELGP